MNSDQSTVQLPGQTCMPLCQVSTSCIFSLTLLTLLCLSLSLIYNSSSISTLVSLAISTVSMSPCLLLHILILGFHKNSIRQFHISLSIYTQLVRLKKHFYQPNKYYTFQHKTCHLNPAHYETQYVYL